MIPVVVVAHPNRRDAATSLADQVNAVICWDQYEGASFADHVARCALNHLTALKSLQKSRTATGWVAIVEDDAIPVDNFGHYLDAALEHAPAPLVGLYLGTGNPSGEAQRQMGTAVRAAEAKNLAWIIGDCLIGSVGYAVKTELLSDIIDFIEEREEELPLRISRWAQDRDVAICYTQPSLVNHDDGESIGRPWRGPHFPGRRAWNFGTRDNWDTPPVTLGHCPVWSAPRNDNA